MRDSIKRDFLADLESRSALDVDGTRVVTIKAKACKLCGNSGHNKRTCPDRLKLRKGKA